MLLYLPKYSKTLNLFRDAVTTHYHQKIPSVIILPLDYLSLGDAITVIKNTLCHVFSNVLSPNEEGSPILHMVQMSRIFQDSKTFVDMKLRYSPAKIEQSYQELMIRENEQPSISAIMQFVTNNFVTENQMECCIPGDWISNPKLLSRISDVNLNRFASDLNSRWKMLCRKVRDDVGINPDLYSLLYLPHPLIVPGGRFR